MSVRIHNSYLRPILEYASVIWNQQRKTINSKLEIPLNTFTRFALTEQKYVFVMQMTFETFVEMLNAGLISDIGTQYIRHSNFYHFNCSFDRFQSQLKNASYDSEQTCACVVWLQIDFYEQHRVHWTLSFSDGNDDGNLAQHHSDRKKHTQKYPRIFRNEPTEFV